MQFWQSPQMDITYKEFFFTNKKKRLITGITVLPTICQTRRHVTRELWQTTAA